MIRSSAIGRHLWFKAPAHAALPSSGKRQLASPLIRHSRDRRPQSYSHVSPDLSINMASALSKSRQRAKSRLLTECEQLPDHWTSTAGFVTRCSPC